jgi:DNA polymerase V
MIGIVDCNSCYASCEQIFRPELRNKPVVVLSNNDGFVIARSKEAKALGIGELEAFFKIEGLLRKHKVTIFSSNYPLYGDISNRVMTTLNTFSPSVEVYSIDEMFLDLTGIQEPMNSYGQRIKQTVWQHIRMPVCVGVAPSKTLAKLANKAAKTYDHCEGVCVLEEPHQWQWLQKRMPVNKVWGIGSKLTKRLAGMNIHTAYDLSRASPKEMRRHMSINIERTIEELNGHPCIPFEEQPPAKRQIYCSRSFGEKVSELAPLLQAISTYASRATEKLRKQKCLVISIHVFLHTSPHESNYYSNAITVKMPYPTDDTTVVIDAARQAITHLYREGFRFQKAGIGLIDIKPKKQLQFDLFHAGQSKKRDQLMTVLDSINSRYGKGTLHIAASGGTKKWAMRQRYLSPAYTTRWSDLPVIDS